MAFRNTLQRAYPSNNHISRHIYIRRGSSCASYRCALAPLYQMCQHDVILCLRARHYRSIAHSYKSTWCCQSPPFIPSGVSRQWWGVEIFDEDAKRASEPIQRHRSVYMIFITNWYLHIQILPLVVHCKCLILRCGNCAKYSMGDYPLFGRLPFCIYLYIRVYEYSALNGRTLRAAVYNLLCVRTARVDTRAVYY